MSILSCKSPKDLPTVPEVDINKYSGTWYEIYRLPNSFEKELSCVSATYSVKEKGGIVVYNKGYKSSKDKWSDIEGSARIPDDKYPGRLKVTFFWPFAGDYYIIELDSNYKYALVGSPSRKYLWILSRTKELDKSTVDMLMTSAQNHGFKTDELEKIDHNCIEK